MARERKRSEEQQATDRATSDGERVRRRLAARPQLELSQEELKALADEGVDPEDVRRVARERTAAEEASEHDRDTVRDELEGLMFDEEEPDG
jgi:hypothetical protein